MKIYMVSKGSYSDWHIVKQFLSKDLAEKFIEAAKDDGWEGDMTVSEWDTDDETTNLDNLGWKVTREVSDGFMNLSRFKDIPKGQVFWWTEYVGDGINEYDFEYKDCKRNAIWISKNDKTGDINFTFWVIASNKDAALKIANERYSAVRVMLDSEAIQENEVYSFPSYEKL